MPRITRVYTRTGDDGTTGLGGGQRVPKDSPRIAAYGTVDELSSTIGVALAAGLDGKLAATLQRIQNELFDLGADLCVVEEDKARRNVPVVEQSHVDALEALMDELNDELGPLANFILPGGAPGAAHLHVARTVCRRAERLLVTLARLEPVGPHTVQYLNRLSDALFVMARYENLRKGHPEVLWQLPSPPSRNPA
jgi:cob(I)alamin adenosyltransferase